MSKQDTVIRIGLDKPFDPQDSVKSIITIIEDYEILIPKTLFRSLQIDFDFLCTAFAPQLCIIFGIYFPSGITQIATKS